MNTKATFPAELRLKGRKCVVVGGGRIAEKRVRLLLDAGAGVRLVTPEAGEELRRLAESGAIEWIQKPFSTEHVTGMFVVVCATDDESVNRKAAWAAKASGALVNMAAPPLELGDFTVPAQASSGRLSFTVSTGGASPGLARALRRELEEKFAAVYGPWLERVAPIRAEMKERTESAEEREAFWRGAMSEDVMALVREGRIEEAEAKVRDAAHRIGAEP